MNLEDQSSRPSPCCPGNRLAKIAKLLVPAAAMFAAGFITPLCADSTLIYNDGDFRYSPFSTGDAGNTVELRVTGGYATEIGGIIGAGTLLKTGPGDLYLGGESTFTGGFVIREGVISFYCGSVRDDESLGGPGGALTINGGMLYSGHDIALDPTRPVAFGANGASLAGMLLIDQTITGPGALAVDNYDGYTHITLGGLQNYTGATTVIDSTLTITGTFENQGGIRLAGGYSYLEIGVYPGDAVRVGGQIDASQGSINVAGNSIVSAAINLGVPYANAHQSVYFQDASSAANSSITIEGNTTLQFWGNSTPASASITNNGGSVKFLGLPAASASIINNNAPGSSGYVSIEGSRGAGTTFAIGHLSGDGNVYLGDALLAIGGLDNRDMLITGKLSYGNPSGHGGVLGGIEKIGDTTLTLAAANAYYGPTILAGGKIVLAAADAIAYGARIDLNDATTLVLNADNTLWNLSGAPAATLELTNGATATLVNAITENIDAYNGDAIITISDGTTAFPGRITGNGSLVKTGDGTLTLAGDNDYTGGTTLEEGELIVATDAALGAPNGAIIIAGDLLAPTLTLADNIAAAGRSLTVAALADPTVPAGSIAAVIDTAGRALAIGQGLAGNGNLQLTGGGSVTLAGNLSHTAAIQVTDATTLTLAGAGGAGGISLNDGTLATNGVQTAASLEWQSGGTLKLDLDRGDRLVVTGAATRFGVSLLNVTPVKAGSWAAGDAHTLATFGSTNLATADFAPLALGNGLTGNITVEGNTLKLTVVSDTPAPAGAYATWINTYGITLAANRAPAADPDNDGIPNLLEYVLALNPAAVESEDIVVSTITIGRNAYPTIAFVRRHALGDAQSAVRIYSDLRQAPDIAAIEVSATRRDSLSDYVIYRSAVPLTQRPNQFFRIEASIPSAAAGFARASLITVLSRPVGTMYKNLANGKTHSLAFPLLDDEWTGIAASATSASITFKTTPAALASGAKYYLEVATGARAGDRYDVVSVYGKTITLNLSSDSHSTVRILPAGLAGERLVLREHMTLAKLATLLDSGNTNGNQDNKCKYKGKYFYRGKYDARYKHRCYVPCNNNNNDDDLTLSSSYVELYQDGRWVACYPNGNGTVWTLEKNPKKTAANVAGTVIPPDAVIKLTVRTPRLTILRTGVVRTNAFSLPLVKGTQILPTGFPCAMNTAELAATIANRWIGAANSGSADQLQFVISTSTATGVYFLDAAGKWKTISGKNATLVIGADDLVMLRRMKADANYVILPPF